MTCSKGNSELAPEDCIWERMRKEIKKDGGCPESAGDGKDGKWAGVRDQLKMRSRDGNQVASFKLGKSHQDCFH